MMNNAYFSRSLVVWACLAAFCMLLFNGCSVLKRRDAAGGDNQSRTAGYLDFDDILIPVDFKPDREKSAVFRIGAVTAGVLAISGRSPSEELVDFFNTNMSQDNWKLVSSFRSSRSMLLFEKGTRWCVITVTLDDYGHRTLAEIWVSPKTEEFGSGLLQ
jgi:hypothetical protein